MLEHVREIIEKLEALGIRASEDDGAEDGDGAWEDLEELLTKASPEPSKAHIVLCVCI